MPGTIFTLHRWLHVVPIFAGIALADDEINAVGNSCGYLL